MEMNRKFCRAMSGLFSVMCLLFFVCGVAVGVQLLIVPAVFFFGAMWFFGKASIKFWDYSNGDGDDDLPDYKQMPREV